MLFDPDVRHRRSIRLSGYDYSQQGAYFVTVCVQNRECLLGKVVDEKMMLNEAGRMVQEVWEEIPIYYPHVEIDAFIVMPNHIHGIIWLSGVGATPRGCPKNDPRGCPKNDPRGCPKDPGQAQGPAPTKLSLPDVVHRFKSLTTHKYTMAVKQSGWFPFPGRLWQRNYYEHIIRNEDDLLRIRKYITDNPVRWDDDENNPLSDRSPGFQGIQERV